MPFRGDHSIFPPGHILALVCDARGVPATSSDKVLVLKRRPALRYPTIDAGNIGGRPRRATRRSLGWSVRVHSNPGRETIDRSCVARIGARRLGSRRHSIPGRYTGAGEPAPIPARGRERRDGALKTESLFMKPVSRMSLAARFFCIMALMDEMVPLVARWHVAFADHVNAGGANPASPAALPYPAGGTGVHTGISTTQLIRGWIMISVAFVARRCGYAKQYAAAGAFEMRWNAAQADSLHRPVNPTGARGADTTFFPPDTRYYPVPPAPELTFLDEKF